MFTSTIGPRLLVLRRAIAGLLMCGAMANVRAEDPTPSDSNLPQTPGPVVSSVPMRPMRLAQSNRGVDIKPTPEVLGKAASLIADVLEPELVLEVRPNRSKLIRTRKPVTRSSISDPIYAEVSQLSPTEFEVIGLKHGDTTLTFWFGEPGEQQEILRYLLVVAPDTGFWEDVTKGYAELETMINEMFPNSQIQLIPVSEKLILRGQARDAEEAAQILSIVRAQASGQSSASASLAQGAAIAPTVTGDQPGGSRGGGGEKLVNMLRVPHEHQILLKVRIAELSRSALRQLGVDFTINKQPGISLTSTLGGGNNLSALFDNGDINLLLRALSTNGLSKILAEPNLVVLNGQTATFIAGGQFAVPTAIGVNGIGAATTGFQGYGTQLLFTPTVLDKDLIRLQVVPTFSSINNDNRVNGIPGLNTRSVSTTVDMRIGQWLAIAGLLQDEQHGRNVRIPGLGDMPFLGIVFSDKKVERQETELLVLVGPELTHPLEPEQMPLLLPGMEVTEPGPVGLYGLGMIEGAPDIQHRSTVYPNVRHEARREAMRDFKANSRFQRRESFYVTGAHGFSE